MTPLSKLTFREFVEETIFNFFLYKCGLESNWKFEGETRGVDKFLEPC